MTHSELKTLVSACKAGTIHQISYTKPLKTRKGITDVIEKTTTMQGRFKVKYDNMKSTKKGRADGSLPSTNAGLPKNTEWYDEYFIKNVNTGKLSLRVAKANGNKTVNVYRKNGVIVDRADIEDLCLKSEFDDFEPPVKNIGIEKITSIK